MNWLEQELSDLTMEYDFNLMETCDEKGRGLRADECIMPNSKEHEGSKRSVQQLW